MSSPPTATYHYPPHIMALLVDAIPLLCRAKFDVLQFFIGAGVPKQIIADLQARLTQDPSGLGKYEIARTTLDRINAGGDQYLAQRREVVKRVVEWEDFSTSWPKDQPVARGLVSQVREAVGKKDAFTQMDLERERERRQAQAQVRDERERVAKRRADLAAVRDELYALFGSNEPARRGKDIEGILNRLFSHFEIGVRESFTVTGRNGEGIVEQIDGVIQLDGHLYFVEVKWLAKPLGKAELAEHAVRLFSRAEARGLVISASGFTDPAVAVARDVLALKVLVLVDLSDIILILDREADLAGVLRQRVNSVVMVREPYQRWEPD